MINIYMVLLGNALRRGISGIIFVLYYLYKYVIILMSIINFLEELYSINVFFYQIVIFMFLFLVLLLLCFFSYFKCSCVRWRKETSQYCLTARQ